jgi:hypothetical protein
MIHFSFNLTRHSRRYKIALKLLAPARCDYVDLLSMLTRPTADLDGELLTQNSDRKVRSESLDGQISIPGRFFTKQAIGRLRSPFADHILLTIHCGQTHSAVLENLRF